LAALAGVLLAYVLVLQTAWAQDLEGRIQVAMQGDLKQLQPDPRVLVLHINRTTMERLHLDSSLPQLPRKFFVDAIRKLRSSGTRVFLVAIPFDTPSSIDQEFRTAIVDANPMSVILVQPPTSGPQIPGSHKAFRGNYAAPEPSSPNCLVASIDFVTRGDKVVGLVPFQVDATGVEVPHAAFAATLRLLGMSIFDVREDADGCRLSSGRRVWPTASDGVYSTMWVQGAIHDNRNFADLLTSESVSWARDRVIIVGDQGTLIKTPIGSRSTAEILAHQVSTALQPNQGGVERWPLEWNLAWAMILALVASVGAMTFRPSVLIGSTVVALLTALLAPQYGLRIANTAFDTVGPTVSVLLAACVALVSEGVALGRRGVGPLQGVAASGSRRVVDATVMFVELIPTESEAETKLFQTVEEIVGKSHGEVEQLPFGGVAAVFSRDGDRSHGEIALMSLTDIRARMEAVGEVLCGIECGAIPANWSSDDRVGDLRSIGSTFHLASRLVDECRTLGVSTLMGPAFAAEFGSSTRLRRIGERTIRGFEGHGPVPVYAFADAL